MVLSGTRKNSGSGTVIIAYMTSAKGDYHPLRVATKVAERTSYVICDQIRTVDKSRLTSYVGFVSEADMKRVSAAVSIALCLPVPTEPKIEDKAKDDEVQKLRVELDLAKAMYDKVLGMLVSYKIQSDLREYSEYYDGDDENENFDDEIEDTVEEVVEEVVRGKINLNTASAKEIMTALGVGSNAAYGITSYRKNNGNFVDLEELRDVKYVPKNFLEKHGEYIEI